MAQARCGGWVAQEIRPVRGAQYSMSNMNVTIRRLMNTFIILFLLISGVAAYVQVNNQAFLNGPTLAASGLDPRACLAPDDQPIRGTIYDRNGIWLARTVRD